MTIALPTGEGKVLCAYRFSSTVRQIGIYQHIDGALASPYGRGARRAGRTLSVSFADSSPKGRAKVFLGIRLPVKSRFFDMRNQTDMQKDYNALASSSQIRAVASLGIVQSPRGLRLRGPAFAPSGIQLRLNCWVKNRR